MSQADKAPSNQESGLPPPCAGGCGFYGNKDQKNCCSLCFKKMYPELASDNTTSNNNNNSNNKNNINIKDNNNSNNEFKQDENKNDNNDNNNNNNQTEEESNAPTKKVQKKKNRCWNCRKKVALAGQFECKCGYVFCSRHRYPDAHSCDFDWKKQYQQKLAADNTTVAPSKLEKI